MNIKDEIDIHFAINLIYLNIGLILLFFYYMDKPGFRNKAAWLGLYTILVAIGEFIYFLYNKVKKNQDYDKIINKAVDKDER